MLLSKQKIKLLLLIQNDEEEKEKALNSWIGAYFCSGEDVGLLERKVNGISIFSNGLLRPRSKADLRLRSDLKLLNFIVSFELDWSALQQYYNSNWAPN